MLPTQHLSRVHPTKEYTTTQNSQSTPLLLSSAYYQLTMIIIVFAQLYLPVVCSYIIMHVSQVTLGTLTAIFTVSFISS